MVEVLNIEIGPDEGIVESVISHYAPDAPLEVKEAIAAFAMGNPGVARVLAERAQSFTSAEEVEALVGWPLSEHSKRSGDIWERFKKSPV